MFKYLPLVFLLLFTSVSADESKWYVGFGLGQAKPKLELDEHIGGVDVDLPDEFGGNRYNVPVSTDSEFSTLGQKLFLGYDFGDTKGFAVELSIINFGQYEGTMEASITDTGTISSQYFADIPYSVGVDGTQTLRADLYATSLSLIYSFQLGNRVSVFPRFGLSHIRGDVFTKTDLTLTATTLGETKSLSWSEADIDSLNVILPMFGVGMDVDLGKGHFIRAEVERYGHPTEEYVDMYTVAWGFHF